MHGDAQRTHEDAGSDPFATAPVGRTVLRNGLPLALGMASHASINLVDLALVGRLGAEAAAAAHVASVVNFVPMIVGNAVSVAAIGEISRRLGRGADDEARAFARRSLRFSLLLGLVVSIASALPAAPCVDSIGCEGAVRTDAIHYLVVSNLGCLPMFALMQTTAVMRACGETAAPLLLLLFANALNLVLDLVLMFGWPALSVPAMGVVGAAYATVASRAIAAGLAHAWLARRRHWLCAGGAAAGERIAVAAPLVHGAWPQTVQIGLRAALVWALSAVVQRRLGDDGTAALSITTRLDTLVLFSAMGFASAATAIAGRAVGRGDAVRARRAGLHAGVQALLFGGLCVLAFQHWAEPLLALFLPAAPVPVAEAFVAYLSLAAVAQPFAACALGAMGAPHGAGAMLAPLVLDAVGFLALFLAMGFAAGGALDSVYVVLVGGSVGVALLHLLLVRLGTWAHRSG